MPALTDGSDLPALTDGSGSIFEAVLTDPRPCAPLVHISGFPCIFPAPRSLADYPEMPWLRSYYGPHVRTLLCNADEAAATMNSRENGAVAGGVISCGPVNYATRPQVCFHNSPDLGLQQVVDREFRVKSTSQPQLARTVIAKWPAYRASSCATKS